MAEGRDPRPPNSLLQVRCRRRELRALRQEGEGLPPNFVQFARLQKDAGCTVIISSHPCRPAEPTVPRAGRCDCAASRAARRKGRALSAARNWSPLSGFTVPSSSPWSIAGSLGKAMGRRAAPVGACQHRRGLPGACCPFAADRPQQQQPLGAWSSTSRGRGGRCSGRTARGRRRSPRSRRRPCPADPTPRRRPAEEESRRCLVSGREEEWGARLLNVARPRGNTEPSADARSAGRRPHLVRPLATGTGARNREAVDATGTCGVGGSPRQRFSAALCVAPQAGRSLGAGAHCIWTCRLSTCRCPS